MKAEELKKAFVRTWRADLVARESEEYMLADINAIMEAYAEQKMKDMYPEEFVNWIGYNQERRWDDDKEKFIWYVFQNSGTSYQIFESLKEVFNYWKENER